MALALAARAYLVCVAYTIYSVLWAALDARVDWPPLASR